MAHALSVFLIVVGISIVVRVLLCAGAEESQGGRDHTAGEPEPECRHHETADRLLHCGEGTNSKLYMTFQQIILSSLLVFKPQ